MIFHYSLFASLLLTVYRLAGAQVPFPNHCPEVKTAENFKLEDYMGIWFEYAKYPFVFEIGKKCMFAKYEKISNDMISVTNAAINRLCVKWETGETRGNNMKKNLGLRTFTDESSNVTGQAKVISSGALAVVFPRSANQKFDKANYLVLDTDYKSFAVVYSCSNLTPFAHTEIVWILTRDRKPKESVVSKAKTVMNNNRLSQVFLMNTIQDNCPNIDDKQRFVASSSAEVQTSTELPGTTKDYDDGISSSTTNNLIATA